jgi:hypothetical protein
LKTKTKGKEKSVALKLDIRKACDRIDCDYLKDVMIKMGLSGKWIQWIMMLLYPNFGPKNTNQSFFSCISSYLNYL